MRAGLRLSGLFAALAALAGCDDGTVITRVDNQIGAVDSYLIPMAAGGLPTEVHGAPFDGVTPEQIVARLRLPGGYPTDIRFRAVAPGPGAVGRLVLAFNPDGPPNGQALCGLTAPRPGLPPREVGFAVTATLCNGARVLTTAHMEARKTRADDPEGFVKAMQRLFTAMLAKDAR